MNSTKNFSIKEALKYPFVTFYNRPLAFLGISLSGFIYFIPALIAMGLLALLNKDFFFNKNVDFSQILYVKYNFILVLIGVLLAFFGAIWYRIFLINSSLKLYNKKEITFSSLFEKSELIFKLIPYYILFSLLFSLGLILLIIPGIYWYITYIFGEFFLVDKNPGVIAAFVNSAHLTRDIKLKLLGYIILLTLVVSLVSIIPIVAIFIEPIRVVSKTYVYKRLLAQS